MPTPEEVAGKVMASVMGLTNEAGESIAERMSVADLWLVIEYTVQVILSGEDADPNVRIPAGLTHDEAKVWVSSTVREALRNGQKIVAIKEARGITRMGLKEAKDIVERMEDVMRKGGVALR